MDTSAYQIETSIVGEDAEDTALLQSMAVDARRFLAGFHWCPPIKALYLGDGIGGVVAVFVAELSERIAGTDDMLWIIVGDLPSVFLVPDEIASPRQALEAYCELMDDWIQAVDSGEGLEEVYPVEAAPTPANARALASRLKFLREEIIPTFNPMARTE